MSQNDPTLLVLSCPCGQRLKVPANALGKTYKCVRCAAHIVVSRENARPIQAPTAEAAGPGQEKEPREVIGQLLVKGEVISATQLSEALEEQRRGGGRIIEALLKLGHLDQERLHGFLSRQPGVATIDLDRFQVAHEVIGLVPKDVSMRHSLLPIDRLGRLLTVAMACPLDLSVIADMEKITGLKVKAVLCKLDALNAAFDKYYPKKPAPAAPDPAEIVRALNAIQSLPVRDETVGHLSELAYADDANLERMREIVSGDPGLAALLLREANGPGWGMPGQVDTLEAAMLLLGLDGCVQVARQAGNSVEDRFVLALGAHACRAASIAAKLACATGKADPAKAFCCAILHEIGRLALLQIQPEKYREIANIKDEGAREKAEFEAFGAAQCTCGAQLLAHWDVAETLCGALRDCGTGNASNPLSHLILVASRLTSKRGASTPKDLESVGKSLEALELSPDAALGI